MCGRYTLTDPGEELMRQFHLPGLPPEYLPRYNIAPSQPVPVIASVEGERRIGMMRWGLVPGWAKDPSIGHRMINARAETVAEKPAFRTALRRRRCLIPADGFYEWQVRNGRKQPVRFVGATERVFAFAGLWESWRPPTSAESAGEAGDAQPTRLVTCTIITTEANDFVRPVHDRMPVILPREAYDLWLDPRIQDPEAILPLLTSAPELRVYDVSKLVNSPANDVPECVEPLAEEE